MTVHLNEEIFFILLHEKWLAATLSFQMIPDVNNWLQLYCNKYELLQWLLYTNKSTKKAYTCAKALYSLFLLGHLEILTIYICGVS